MNQESQNSEKLTIAVLTGSQDDVELINKTLRDAGQAVHCLWTKTPDSFDTALRQSELELVVTNCDRYPDSIRQVVKQRDMYQPEVPVVAIQESVSEENILAAMREGASDLVSADNRERLRAVLSRELRACRVERALNSTLKSATTYRKQLNDYMEVSATAIAYVQEGIITSANPAWLERFGIASKDELDGLPLMDHFEADSQAAVKGALVATERGKWQPDAKLDVRARTPDERVTELKLGFSLAHLDGGQHVQVSIIPVPAAEVEPTKLVHDALKRDPTTLFFHRGQFLERITKRMGSRPKSGLYVLAHIRIDGFSKVCSQVGLVASEEIIGQFAELLGKRLHPRDFAGRFEGTVLMAMLNRGNVDDAEVWGQQLVEKVQSTTFGVGENKVNLTCTVGICPISSAFETVDDFVAATAAAGLNGRKQGGNCVAFNDDLDDDTKQRRNDAIWVKRIKAALVENRFRVAQLPIAGLRNDGASMFDMLVRMIDEHGEPILPSEFLPAAERNNLLQTIDRFMIGASLDYCVSSKAGRVFVRLSNHSLKDPTLLPWLQKQFVARNLAPSRLCLQASEKEVARFIKPARHLVVGLHKLGVAFALEHYGIKHGRLQILDILKPAYLKIDGELMHSLMRDPELQEKVSTLVEEAGKRGIETIAERVENANAMAVLFQLGINFMQGHYIHEPEVVLAEPEAAPSTTLENVASA